MSQIKKIYSNQCWVENKIQPATVCFEKGKIVEVLYYKTAEAEDIGDDILMPGVIDAHVHVNEPGRTDWEGFETATSSAAAGGITTIVDMPLNASPVTTSAKAFQLKLASAQNKLQVNCGFYGGLVPGNCNELEGLINAGVIGIKCFLTHSGIDEFPPVTEKDLDLAMPLLAKYNIPLLVHGELESECKNDLCLHPTHYKEYLESRPKQWENDAVALMVRLCRKHRCRVHLVHISSAESLSSIELAKSEDLLFTAETCAHYIYFNAEHIPDAKCMFKCAPPIREMKNNEQLKEALKKGILDFITTDHSPAPPAIKEIESGNLQKAWGGIAGLQFLLSASYTALRSMLSLEEFIPLLTEHPSCFIGMANRKGKIALGYDADLVVWNPDKEMIVREVDIWFRHKISPYIGMKLKGVVNRTIINGITVYQDNKIVNKNAGQIILTK